MREIDRFISTLFPDDGSRLMDLKFFPGEQLVTVDEFCKEVRSAFAQVDSGQSPCLAGFPEELTRVSVDNFLARK